MAKVLQPDRSATLLRNARGEQGHEPFAALGVFFVEAGRAGAVEVEHADDAALVRDGHHQFAARGAVAGNVAGEQMYIIYPLGCVLRHRCAADAFAHRDPDAGGLSLEGTQHQDPVGHFIKTHPGFSYKGARGILAFTGYNGILGYRTDEAYKDTNPNYEADRQEAAKVAQSLKDHGWELSSHSWGHRNMGEISMNHFKTDTDKWERNVESIIGPTDIILFPFGSDIGSWTPYTDSNERFTYLKSKGFRYFCNVDASKPVWMQLGPDYFRQARRNLDGYRMFYYPDSLNDLFNVPDVFDPARPTPVPPMK